MLSSAKFTQMVSVSFPQDVAGRANYEKIVDKIYSHGMDDIKSIISLKNAILNDLEARNLMECILQF